MSFILSNFLGGPSDSSANNSANSPEMKRELIDKVCAKMTDSAHLEDRRAAAQTLKSLAHSHQLEIGTFGLQALVEELRRDGEDEETAKVCLETLNIIFSPSQDEEDAGIEVQFCEIFLKSAENVQLLVDRLDESNFYLRFTSIQLLTSLAQTLPAQLQASIMASPSGVTKILQLLSDEREVIRNEGILLLSRLVSSHADLQKVVAFQGAFELLLQIAVDEGGAWDGPSTVQDALDLAAALLEFNTSNQNYFRDSICFKRLAGLLGLPEDETRELWNRNRIANFEAALLVLSKLINRENVDLEKAQNLVLGAHYLHPLLILAFDSKIPYRVATAALRTVSDLIWRNPKTQAAFADAKLTRIAVSVPVRLPCSPLLATTLIALHGSGHESHDVRLAALDCFESYCSGNDDGQLAILSTLNPPPTQNEASIGSAIADALFDLDVARKRDPWHIWMASQLLSSCLKGNLAAKSKLLKYRLTEDEESVLNLLMIHLIRISRDSHSSSYEKTVIGYLSLLACWLEEYPAGVMAFLQESSYLQYLIERVTQSIGFDVEVQGLGAIVLGFCVLYNDDTNTSFTSEALKGLIKNRIGPDLYISRLHRFKQSQRDLLTWNLKIDFDNLTNLVARPTPAGSCASQTATLASLSKELSTCRALYNEAQSACAAATKTAETLKIGIVERDAYILQLQKMISDKNQRIAQLAHDLSVNEQQLLQEQLKGTRIESGTESEAALREQNELLSAQVNQYYQQYLADQAAIENLNQTLANMKETVQSQQQRISQLEAMLEGRSSNDEELEKWRKAYHELYERVSSQVQSVSEAVSAAAEQTATAAQDEPNTVATESLASESDANARELSEIATQAAQLVLDSPSEGLQSIETASSDSTVQLADEPELQVSVPQAAPVTIQGSEPVGQDGNGALKVNDETNVVVLSPSQFMSPLASTEETEASPSSVEVLNMNDFEPEPVPEFPIVSNSLPDPEHSDLYPSLPEPLESIPKPATITADVTDHHQPSQQAAAIEEPVQFIPTNPLPNANAAVVEPVYPDLAEPVIEKSASLTEPSVFESEVVNGDRESSVVVVEEPQQQGQNDELEDLSQKQEIKQVLDFFDNLPDVPESSFIGGSFELPSEIKDIQEVTEEIENVQQVDVIPQFDYNGFEQEEEEEGQEIADQNGKVEDTNEPASLPMEYQSDELHQTEEAVSYHESQQQAEIQDQQEQESSLFEQYFEQVCAENEQFEQEFAAQLSIGQSSETQEYSETFAVMEQSADLYYKQEYSQTAEIPQADEPNHSHDYTQAYDSSQDYAQAYDQSQDCSQAVDYSQEGEYNQTRDYSFQTDQIDPNQFPSFSQEYLFDQSQEYTQHFDYSEGCSQPEEGQNHSTHEYSQASEPIQDYYQQAESVQPVEGQTQSVQDYSHHQGYSQEYSQHGYAESQDYSQQADAQSQDYSQQDYDESQDYSQQADAQSQEYSQQDYAETQDYSQQEYFHPQEQSELAYTQGYPQSSDQSFDYAQIQDQQVEASQGVDHAQTQTQEYDYSQVYYDEATGYSYGYDPSCGQYYYYDHSTGEYHYYTPDDPVAAAVTEEDVASNPSLPLASGPPLVPLQAHGTAEISTMEGRQPDEVYSI